LSEHQLQREVAKALDWLIGVLEACPPDLWQQHFGIAPAVPPLSKWKMRQKGLEFLRHKLMANKQ
jgi:hypothetical protein